MKVLIKIILLICLAYSFGFSQASPIMNHQLEKGASVGDAGKFVRISSSSPYYREFVDPSTINLSEFNNDLTDNNGIYSGNGTITGDRTVTMGGSNFTEFRSGDSRVMIYPSKIRVFWSLSGFPNNEYLELTRSRIEHSATPSTSFRIHSTTSNLVFGTSGAEQVLFSKMFLEKGFTYEGFTDWTGLVSNSLVPKEYVDDEITAAYQSFDVAQLTGTNLELSLTNDGVATEVISLASLQDGTGTDDQNITGSSFNSGTGDLTIGIENGTNQTFSLDGRYLTSETDGSVSNEGVLSVNAGTATTAIIKSNSFSDDGVALEAGSNISITENTTTDVITISATGDGTGTDDQNITGSSFSSTTGDLTIGIENGTNQTVSLDGRYLTSETDGSTSNEGSLSVAAGTATTSIIQSNTSGSSDITLEAGTNVTISENTSTDVITINATGDGTGTDDQNIIGSSFSASTGDLTIGIENGSNQTISLDGRYARDVVDMIAGNGLTGGGDLSADRIFSVGAGSGIAVNANDVELEISNLTANSMVGGDFLAFFDSSVGDDQKIAVSNVDISEFDLSNTALSEFINDLSFLTSEVDGSISNEGILSVNAGTSTSAVIKSNTLGDDGVTLEAGSNITITENTTTDVITIASTGGSNTDEGSLTVGAGTSTTSLIQSNTSGSADITLSAGTGISLSEFGNTITITSSGGSTAQDLSYTASTGALGISGGTGVTLTNIVPAGGSAGQVLKKNSATDYDYSWAADATGTGGGSDNIVATSQGGSYTADFTGTNRLIKLTLTGALTLTMSNGTSGTGTNYLDATLQVIQDGTGGRTITWPANVKFPGGVSPVLSSGANDVDIFQFYWDGSDWILSSAVYDVQ